MNRIINVCLILAVLISANSAFASRGRELVMGSADPLGILGAANHGSFYYDDNYNVFYNPSYANEWKNWVAVEKFNGNNNVGKPSAEGGFVASMMNFSLGAFFNRGDGMKGTYQSPAGTAVTQTMSPIDIVFAADMGVKWGLGLTYGTRKDGADLTGTELDARFGAQVMGFEPFVDVMVIGKDKFTAGTENKNKNITVGTKYKWGEWVPFAAFQSITTFSVAATPVETKNTNWGLGIGRNTKLAEGTTFNYSVGFWSGKNDAADTKRSVLPINVSVESELTSWLVGRAGVGYNLIDRTSTAGADAVSNNNGTVGRFGATFKLSKVDIDWAVGSTAGTENADGQTFDFANGLFAAASMTYRW